MLPDAECVAVLQEALEELGLPQYVVKVNHRRLLDAMFQASGVAAADRSRGAAALCVRGAADTRPFAGQAVRRTQIAAGRGFAGTL